MSAQNEQDGKIIDHNSYQAQFPGGEDSLRSYLKEKTIYPPSAKGLNIEGTVKVRFTISRDGDVKNIRIIESLYPSIDSAAVEVISSMPKWKPGKEGNTPVPIDFILPLYFAPPEDEDEVEGEIFAIDNTITKPEFPGGDMKLVDFLHNNLKMPIYNCTECLEGRVFVRIVISKDGKVKNLI